MLGMRKISNADYHSGPGLSSSELKELLKSPAHYKSYKANPIEPTPQMIKGSLVHAMILEPETFHDIYAVGDFKDKRSREYLPCVKANPNKIVVSKAQVDEAAEVVESFLLESVANPELKRLTTGIKEHGFYWEDPGTGVLCKAKPDILTPDLRTIVDIKTAADASFDAFQKVIVDLKYFVSAAFYARGVQACYSKIPLPEFVFIVIETKAPYAIAVYKLDEAAMDIGAQYVDKALNAYAESIATDMWAGYKRETLQIGLPNWAYYRLNER